jgi:hypothetical protein
MSRNAAVVDCIRCSQYLRGTHRTYWSLGILVNLMGSWRAGLENRVRMNLLAVRHGKICRAFQDDKSAIAERLGIAAFGGNPENRLSPNSREVQVAAAKASAVN